jgi:hypothetical protein
MPTTLPDRATRRRQQHGRRLAEFAALAAAAFYLLLLAWNLSTLGADFSASFRPDRGHGGINDEYNPMEPSHRTQAALHWPGWRAQR